MKKFEIGKTYIMNECDHHYLKQGEKFYVENIYPSGNAVISGHLVSCTRLDRGGVTLVSFSKSDLKAGVHVIEQRDNLKFLLVDTNINGVCGVSLDGAWHASNILDSVKEDLTGKTWANRDIIKIYTLSSSNTFKELRSELHLVWQREEKTEAEIQYEACQEKMKELQEEMDKLKQKM